MKSLSLIAFGLLLVGCSAAPLNPQATQVELHTEKPSGACKSLGEAVGDQGNWVTGDFTSNKDLLLGARKAVPLTVSGPFHTFFMQPAGDALRERFKSVSFGEMKIPVVFNCLGREKTAEESIPELLERQVQSPVYFWDRIE